MLRDRLRVLATWLVCAWTAVAAAPISVQYGCRVREAFQRAKDSEQETLAHYSGADYAEAIRRIRDAIPEDGAYALAVLPGPHADEARKIVRYHLAPRRAVYIGELGSTGPPAGVELPEVAVIASFHDPAPRLVPTSSVLPPP